MAKKKDGITDLTKLLVIAAGKFTPNQYTQLTSTIFALLNGVNYGYTELGPRFLQDAHDIYTIHNKDLKKTSFFKNHKPDPSMVSNFKKKKGKKQIQTPDNIISFEHYKFWKQS
jgi:hypothetical protein